MDQEQLQASIFSDHRQYDFTNIPKPMLNGRFRQVILSRPMTDLQRDAADNRGDFWPQCRALE
jgi:hypothetical protein